MQAEGAETSSPATRRAPPRRAPGSRRSASSCSPTSGTRRKTVTAALVPDGLDWKAFNSELKRRGLVLAGGQGKLTGKIFRLGHLGSVTLEEILGAIEHARDRVDRAGPAGRAGRGGRRRAASPRSSRTGIAAGRRRGRRVRVLVAEPRRAARASSSCAPHHEVDEQHRPARRDELVRDPARLRRADRPQPGPGRRRADRRRARGWSSSAGPGSASTTSTSTPRRGPGSPSSTPRPATRSPPPSTRSRCSTASPAGPPRPTRRSAAASGSAPQFTGLELRGRTLGIVGLGKIGQAIAVRARAMEMTVLGVDPYVTRRAGRQPRRRARRLRRRCSSASDVVTVHVPLTRATRGPDRPRRRSPG